MDSGCGLSQFPAVLFVTAQRAGAAVSGLHHALGGCRAPVSVPDASVAQDAVWCECGVLVRCLYRGLVGGLPFVALVALLACVGGLAFIMCVCVKLTGPIGNILS